MGAMCALALSLASAEQQTPPPTPPAAAPAPKARASTRVVQVFGRGSYLGVDTRDVTSDQLAALKLKEERGVEVTMVDAESPAGKAGLKEHDVILSFNGQDVQSVEQLRRMIHEIPPGRKVTIGISRDGKPMSLTAQLADRGELGKKVWKEGSAIVIPPIPPIDVQIPEMSFSVQSSSPKIGVLLEPLTAQLGEYFGVPGGRGLLVFSVEKGSAAETAGLKAGDVIVKLNDSKVADLGDWRMAIRGQSGNVNIGLIRDKHEQSVTVKVPERKRGAIYFNGDEWNSEEIRASLQNLGPEIQRALEKARREFQDRSSGFNREWREKSEDWRKEFEEQRKEQEKLRKEQMKLQLEERKLERDARLQASKLERELRQEQQRQEREARRLRLSIL